MNMTSCLSIHRTALTVISLLAVSGELVAEDVTMPLAPASASTVWPAPGGPFDVGVRTFAWTDESRSASGRPGGTGERTLFATAWYPAAGDGKPALYAPGVEKVLAALNEAPEESRQFIRAHEPLQGVATHSAPDAGPAEADYGWPVVLFSPGGNVSRHFQTALAERLASRGYAVVALSHPHSSLDFDTGFTMSQDWDLDNEDRRIADANDNLLADILATDARFVLSQLRAMQDDPLVRTFDFDRVSIAGHSRGGKTVGRACADHADFRACVVLDNIGPARERASGIRQPFLTLRAPWGEERVAELHAYLGRTGSVAFDVTLNDSNHFSCTDLPVFVPQLRADGRDQIEGIDACAGIIAAFLDAHLPGGSKTAGWLPAALNDHVTVREFAAR